MALTVDNFVRTVFGNKVIAFCNVDFDASYPTGGEALAASTLGMKKVEFLLAEPKLGYVFEYDYANSKLKAYWADFSATAAGALSEVADTTNLSAVADVRVFAVGYGRG